MILKRLESGYWYARWGREQWAQWPQGRDPTRDDFFNPEWTFTPSALRNVLLAMERELGGEP